MSNECRCCGGRCGGEQPAELNRRDFMEKLAVGTAALSLAGGLASSRRRRGKGLPNASQALWRANLPGDAASRLSREEPGSGRHAHRRHRHRQHLAGRRGPTGRLANLQQPQRAANPRQFLRRSRAAALGRGGHPRAADQGRRIAAAGGVAQLRRRLSDRPALVPRSGLAGPGGAGSAQPDDPAGCGQLVDPLCDFSAHGQERGDDAGRGDLLRHAAKRGRQRRGGRHSGRAIRRLRRQPQPRGAQHGLDGRGHGQIGRPGRLRAGEGPHGRRAGSARPGAVLAGRTVGPDGRAGRVAGADCRRGRRRAGGRRRARFLPGRRRARAPKCATSPPWPRSSRISKRRPTKAGRSPARPLARALPTAPKPGSSRSAALRAAGWSIRSKAAISPKARPPRSPSPSSGATSAS